MVGMEEYVFPTARSIDAVTSREMEEERRLCYVGFTRARRILYVTHAVSRRRFDHIARNRISRFLDDVPKNCFSGALSKSPVTLPPALAAISKPAAKPPVLRPISAKAAPPNFKAGDNVHQPKYGTGIVLAIENAGADYEVTVQFPTAGRKKFMASLAKLTQIK
jgi:DNA helicase-2/ATP-dependent DNA helicase PcrA